MDVRMIIVEAMETVIGAEKAVGKKIDIKKISLESFLTINRMTAAIEAQL